MGSTFSQRAELAGAKECELVFHGFNFSECGTFYDTNKRFRDTDNRGRLVRAQRPDGHRRKQQQGDRQRELPRRRKQLCDWRSVGALVELVFWRSIYKNGRWRRCDRTWGGRIPRPDEHQSDVRRQPSGAVLL